jgi:membrane protease YdiL (CAAX protease family)
MENRYGDGEARGRKAALNAWIRRLSPLTEFLIVILSAFGYLIIGSLLSSAAPLRCKTIAFSSYRLYGLLIYEIIILGAIALFLRERGWRVKDFNLQISWRLTGRGLLLMISAYVLIAIGYVVLKLLWNTIDNAVVTLDTRRVDVVVAAAISLVNPIFEETIVVGYVVEALKRPGKAWLGVALSAIIRTLYHLYQGPPAAFSVMLIGILFACAYLRWSRLWPLLVAHGLMDFMGFMVHQQTIG